MDYFYHNILRQYVIAFAHMFSDIHYKRLDSNGAEISDKVVPITYAGKRKLYTILKTTPDDAIVSTILPRIGFLFTGMTYDPSRKMNSHYTVELDDGTTMTHKGVPYNITCDLAILTKNQDDMLQIIEQIAPMFIPEKTLTIKEIPDSDVKRDVPINLDSISIGNITEFGDIEERIITSDLSFTIKGNLYPAITPSSGDIYTVLTNLKSVSNIPPETSELITSTQPANMAIDHTGDPLTLEIIKSITENY